MEEVAAGGGKFRAISRALIARICVEAFEPDEQAHASRRRLWTHIGPITRSSRGSNACRGDDLRGCRRGWYKKIWFIASGCSRSFSPPACYKASWRRTAKSSSMIWMAH